MHQKVTLTVTNCLRQTIYLPVYIHVFKVNLISNTLCHYENLVKKEKKKVKYSLHILVGSVVICDEEYSLKYVLGLEMSTYTLYLLTLRSILVFLL